MVLLIHTIVTSDWTVEQIQGYMVAHFQACAENPEDVLVISHTHDNSNY